MAWEFLVSMFLLSVAIPAKKSGRFPLPSGLIKYCFLIFWSRICKVFDCWLVTKGCQLLVLGFEWEYFVFRA